MAYYDALIAAWNNPTQPPPGCTGNPITAGMTTDQKIAAVNSWTVVGPATPMIIPTYQIYNVIVRAEYAALAAALQQQVSNILSMGTVDGSPGTQVRTTLISIFPSGTQTFANLSALAKQYDQPQIPWWQANGYAEPIGRADTIHAGLS